MSFAWMNERHGHIKKHFPEEDKRHNPPRRKLPCSVEKCTFQTTAKQASFLHSGQRVPESLGFSAVIDQSAEPIAVALANRGGCFGPFCPRPSATLLRDRAPYLNRIYSGRWVTNLLYASRQTHARSSSRSSYVLPPLGLACDFEFLSLAPDEPDSRFRQSLAIESTGFAVFLSAVYREAGMWVNRYLAVLTHATLEPWILGAIAGIRAGIQANAVAAD
jgi:hypothetical protein